MRFFILFAGILFCAFTVQGEDADDITFCQLLPEHQPSADVEYQPGVGPNGPVVPADVNGGQDLHGFETIQIPVEINLIERFGLDVPPGTELKPYAALISIHNDGKVEYNGQDISKQAHKLCNKGKDHE